MEKERAQLLVRHLRLFCFLLDFVLFSILRASVADTAGSELLRGISPA